ncbi:MAG: iron-sulfur cluster assembly accessory protein [Candidatus Zixiibacteriota bacterium]
MPIPGEATSPTNRTDPTVHASVPVIDLTEAAAAEVRRLIDSRGLTDVYLRVGVQGGGCSGLSYLMDLDSNIGPHDKIFEVRGVKIIVDLKSALYLRGTVIDHANSLVGGGFKFSNPNASKSCGCGTSFSA